MHSSESLVKHDNKLRHFVCTFERQELERSFNEPFQCQRIRGIGRHFLKSGNKRKHREKKENWNQLNLFVF